MNLGIIEEHKKIAKMKVKLLKSVSLVTQLLKSSSSHGSKDS